MTRMTRFELPDAELLSTVKEVISLYNQAQTSVFKLMASVSRYALLILVYMTDSQQDSVPKFLRDPKYYRALHDLNSQD